MIRFAMISWTDVSALPSCAHASSYARPMTRVVSGPKNEPRINRSGDIFILCLAVRSFRVVRAARDKNPVRTGELLMRDCHVAGPNRSWQSNGQTKMMPPSNLFQSFPERIFEADAGLVTGDYDGPFDHRRFQQSCVHRNKPPPDCTQSVTTEQKIVLERTEGDCGGHHLGLSNLIA